MYNIHAPSQLSLNLGRYVRAANPVTFVALMFITSYVLTLMGAMLGFLLGLEADPGRGPSLSDGSVAEVVVVAIVIAPLLETAVFQWLPVRVMRHLRIRSNVAVIGISALGFGLAHWYSLIYVFAAAGAGIAFAYAFVVCDAVGRNGYVYVVLIHALRNAVAIAMTYVFG